ncbi:TPA: hypothetical protein ACUQTZ_004044 [Escherichia coli]|nr:hypothetical protein [Escherichia phage vB-Eco-KMB35]
MVTLMIMEFENSAATYREMTMAQAYRLASNGNFYKAQIINEFGVIDYEF